MFEREIQFIYDFNQNKVRKLGSFATFKQLETVNLHPAILRYISGEIDFLIYEDRQKLLKDSLFDYSGENINKYFGLIRDEIKRSKRFSLGYIEKLILHASSFNINYLSRPNWALMRFVFEEEKEKPAPEIKQILNYLYYYPHLRKIITSYIDSKKLFKIEAKAFADLLIRIDQLALGSNHSKVFGEALESMGDFFNIGVSKKSLVPLKAVELFLQDKSLNSHLEVLTKTMDDPNITKYEVQDYKRVLSSVVYEREEIIEEKQEDEKVFEVERDEELAEDEIDQLVEEITEVKYEKSKTVDHEINEEPVEEEVVDSSEDSVTEAMEVDNDSLVTPDIDTANDHTPESKVIELEEEEIYDASNVEEVMELAKEEEPISQIDDEIELSKDNALNSDEDVEEFLKVEEQTDDSSIEEIIDEAKEFYLKETYDEKISGSDEPLIEKMVDEITEHRLEVSEEENDLKIFEEEFGTEPASEIDKLPLEKDKEPEKRIEDHLELEDTDNDEEIIDEPVEKVFDEPVDLPEEEFGKEPGVDELDKMTEEIDDEGELKLFDDEVEEKTGLTEVEKEVLNEMRSSVKADEKESMYDGTHAFDITEMLENKKMSKILDVIFDYDMEDFANAIDKITESESEEEAFMIIDKLCESAQISTSSKEAKTFKSIVSDYFNRR